LGIPSISTGELLRQAVAAESDLGRRVAATLASGRLVDDDLIAEVVASRIAEEDAANGFLLDGYPRTMAQADTLDRLLAAGGAGLDAVVFLDVPEEVLVRRALARRREDDEEPVVRRRLGVYREKTEPLVDRYSRRGLLVRVDGDRSVEAITEDILNLLRGR